MLVTVIIPIYNAEKYLQRCLSSLARQTYPSLELLMVDDGSTDNSAEICYTFTEKDARFQYINEGHGGCSHAVNIGIANASGEYLSFVDADDEVKPDYIEQLLLPVTRDKICYMLILGGMEIERGNKMQKYSQNETIRTLGKHQLTGREYVRCVLTRQMPVFLFQTRTSKLYHKKLFADKSVKSDEDMSISEDSHFNTMLLRKFMDDSIICLTPFCGYFYYCNPISSVHQKRSYKKIKDGIRSNSETLAVRYELFHSYFMNDKAVRHGLEKALAIVSLANASCIESNALTKAQKKELYKSFLGTMLVGIKPEMKDYPLTDKLILYFSYKKHPHLISLVYKLRDLKHILRYS